MNIKEFVKRLVLLPKAKPTRTFRYCYFKLITGYEAAWDFGKEFTIDEGNSFVLLCDDERGFEGIKIGKIILPSKIIFNDGTPVRTEEGVFWLQLSKPSCKILPGGPWLNSA